MEMNSGRMAMGPVNPLFTRRTAEPSTRTPKRPRLETHPSDLAVDRDPSSRRAINEAARQRVGVGRVDSTSFGSTVSAHGLSDRIDDSLQDLSLKFYNGDMTSKQFFEEAKTILNNIDDLETNYGPQGKAMSDPIRTTFTKLVTRVAKDVKEISDNPTKIIREFFNSYEDIQRGAEFTAFRSVKAHQKFNTAVENFHSSEDAPSVTLPTGTEKEQKTKLLNDIAYGMVTEDTFLLNDGGVSKEMRNQITDQLVEAGLAHKLPDGRIKLVAHPDVGIHNFTLDCSKQPLSDLSALQKTELLKDVRRNLNELSRSRQPAIMMGSNVEDASRFLPRFDSDKVSAEFIRLSREPSYAFIQRDELMEIATKNMLNRSSKFVQKLMGAVYDKDVVKLLKNHQVEDDDLNMKDPKQVGSFGASFHPSFHLESCANEFADYSVMSADYSYADQAARIDHSEIGKDAEKLKRDGETFVVPDLWEDEITGSSVDQLKDWLGRMDTDANSVVMDVALRAKSRMRTLSEKTSKLESAYGVHDKMYGAKVKKVAKDVLLGALSPVTAPIREVFGMGKAGVEEAKKSEGVLKSVGSFFKGFAVGGLKTLKKAGKWLLGPIGEGIEFLYEHKKSKDLGAALGRTFDSATTISRSGRRYKGKMAATDFCNVPPLRGGTATSSKEISGEVFKLFGEIGAVSDEGIVNLKPLLTTPIKKKELEAKLTAKILASYKANNTDSFNKLSEDDQKELAKDHAKLFLNNSLNKLKTVGTIKGKVYLAKKCQDVMDRIKNTAGWITALGAGVLAPVFPLPLIGLGLLAGGVGVGSAAIKVVGGVAHANIVENSHKSMFEDIPYDHLTEFGQDFYAESVADIMAIQAQVLNDFTHGVAMVSGVAGPGVLTGLGSGDPSAALASYSPGDIGSGLAGNFSTTAEAVSLADGVIGTTAAYTSDFEQEIHEDNSGTGLEASIRERIDRRQLTANRWHSVIGTLRHQGGRGLEEEIRLIGLVVGTMDDDVEPEGEGPARRGSLRVLHEGGLDLDDTM
ncbi:hypothetical protein HOG98_06570 [bacterium]|jgi:hypothetical protein|nr:hypothetical protein [bacterium]